MSHSDQITIRFPASWLEAIDRGRGGLNRSIYLRRVVQRALRLPTVPETRGRGEAIAVGIMSPATLNKELERRADAEKRRSAKREAKQRPKKPPATPAVVFTFHSNGMITSSDLDPLATYVGVVDDRGHYSPESTRYGVDRVRQELLQQMASEPGREWPERYRRFIQ